MNLIHKIIGFLFRTIAVRFLKYYTCEVLLRLIKENNYKSYAEIGVWKGNTLFKIASKNKDMKIFGIDSYTPKSYKGYNQGEVMASANCYEFFKIKKKVIEKSLLDFDNVSIIIQDSLSAVKRFKDDSLDIVFIDANHSYKEVCKDIKAWLPKVRKGGILSGHDFHLAHPAVIQAVTDSLGYNLQIKEDVSMWIYRK